MMQAIVKACLAVSITMGALMAGTATGQAPSSETSSPSDEAVPAATCDDLTCDSSCIARGNCEGSCSASGVCRCIRHLPTGGCP